MMKRIFLLLVLLAPLAAQAQLTKCVNANGKVEYRDHPCDKNTKEQEIEQRVVDMSFTQPAPKPAKDVKKAAPPAAPANQEEKKKN